MSAWLPAMRIFVSIGTVGASIQIGEILPPCDFFWLSCPVLSLPFSFLDPTPRSNRWTDFHALWLKRRVSAQGWSFGGENDGWPFLGKIYPQNSPKMGVNMQFPAQTAKYKLQYLQNYKSDQNQIWGSSWDRQLHFVGGLTLLRSNPIWLLAAILKI